MCSDLQRSAVRSPTRPWRAFCPTPILPSNRATRNPSASIAPTSVTGNPIANNPVGRSIPSRYRVAMPPTPAALRALARRDPKLGAVMKTLPAYPGFPDGDRRNGTHWESLTRAIVFQQLAGAAASTIHGRVCALTAGSRFPRVAEYLELADDDLRGAGLSRAKCAALRDLAERIDDGRLRLRSIGRLSDADIIERLITVRGIGVWSAQMFLMFRLGRLDVMPSGDLGVREGVRLLDSLDARPTPKETEARGAVWAPLRSVGAWFMWRLVEDGRARAQSRRDE